MTARNASAAIIGAGDFIGAAIARKFAAEGFSVLAGRRNGDKLGPLLSDIAKAGGTAKGRSLDARDEADITPPRGDPRVPAVEPEPETAPRAAAHFSRGFGEEF